jgi:hypothetical protein
MSNKPTYEKLEQKVKQLEKEVSRHKQLENELRTSEEKFKKIFDNANIIPEFSFLPILRILNS